MAKTFVRLLGTNSATDIALIKSVLDAEGVRYFIQGENQSTIRPVDQAVLMVAEDDVTTALDLLRPLKLRYELFGRESV
jgi:hypothetical protein